MIPLNEIVRLVGEPRCPRCSLLNTRLLTKQLVSFVQICMTARLDVIVV